MPKIMYRQKKWSALGECHITWVFYRITGYGPFSSWKPPSVSSIGSDQDAPGDPEGPSCSVMSPEFGEFSWCQLQMYLLDTVSLLHSFLLQTTSWRSSAAGKQPRQTLWMSCDRTLKVRWFWISWSQAGSHSVIRGASLHIWTQLTCWSVPWKVRKTTNVKKNNRTYFTVYILIQSFCSFFPVFCRTSWWNFKPFEREWTRFPGIFWQAG